MANPKYANLPGIAYDQPDMYETNDLPESEQGIVEEEQQSEFIERLHLSAPEAYAKFKGKWLDGSKADFSDAVSRRARKGYDFVTEYELVGEGTGESETLLQKYQRLQHEIRGLSEDVQKAQAEQTSDLSATQTTATVLEKQLESLGKQFSSIRVDQLAGDDASLKNLSDSEGVTYKKLQLQLDAFRKQTGTAIAPTGKKPADKGSLDQMLYELMFKPDLTDSNQTTKVADIEHRLQKLESVIGGNPEKINVMTSDTTHKSLMEIILHLNTKMNLLDPAHLDQIDGRLTALSLRLGQLSEKRAAFKDSDEYNKIQNMYDILKKAEGMTAVLPDIITRLAVLKDLHEQALQFSKLLSQLDTTQQQITQKLTNCQGELKEARSGFASNLDLMKRNLENLDKRIVALKK